MSLGLSDSPTCRSFSQYYEFKSRIHHEVSDILAGNYEVLRPENDQNSQ